MAVNETHVIPSTGNDEVHFYSYASYFSYGCPCVSFFFFRFIRVSVYCCMLTWHNTIADFYVHLMIYKRKQTVSNIYVYAAWRQSGGKNEPNWPRHLGIPPQENKAKKEKGEKHREITAAFMQPDRHSAVHFSGENNNKWNEPLSRSKQAAGVKEWGGPRYSCMKQRSEADQTIPNPAAKVPAVLSVAWIAGII